MHAMQCGGSVAAQMSQSLWDSGRLIRRIPNAPDLVTATRSDLSATSLAEAIEEIVKLVPDVSCVERHRRR